MDLKPKMTLLQRVVTFAKSELERLSRTQLQESVPEPSHAAAPARAAHARTERAVETTHQQASEPASVAAATPVEVEPSVRGLEVSRAPAAGQLRLRWSFSPSDVSRAGALIDGSPVLCLRVVSFTKARDDVLREVQDRPGVELSGECDIVEPPQRAVVSLGLRSGERFVSLAHHVL